MLTPGNVSDVKAAPALLERAGRMRYLLGDKGYDADRLRRLARDVGAIPVIPGRRNRKRAIRYDKQRYAGRRLTLRCCLGNRPDILALNESGPYKAV